MNTCRFGYRMDELLPEEVNMWDEEDDAPESTQEDTHPADDDVSSGDTDTEED